MAVTRCHAGDETVFKILNMRPNLRAPVVGIPADRRILGPHPFHCVGEKYLRAVQEGAGALPFLLPVPAEVLDPRNTWTDKAAYDAKARELAAKFRDNDRKFSITDAVRNAGPKA